MILHVQNCYFSQINTKQMLFKLVDYYATALCDIHFLVKCNIIALNITCQQANRWETSPRLWKTQINPAISDVCQIKYHNDSNNWQLREVIIEFSVRFKFIIPGHRQAGGCVLIFYLLTDIWFKNREGQVIR